MILKVGAGVLAGMAFCAMFFLTLVAGQFRTNASASSGGNGQVVAAAELMAGHLSGARAQDYGSDFPQKVVGYWASVCPEINHDPTKGCYPDWQSGNLQCVMFVTGTYYLAGQTLPASGNAVDFWTLYQNRKGWTELPSGTAVPAPGDIIVWSSQSLVSQPVPHWVNDAGHVAIVTSVSLPSATHPGNVQFAEANGPGAIASLPLQQDTKSGGDTIDISPWQSSTTVYSVLGDIRSAQATGLAASLRVQRISQLDPSQYGSPAEYNTWAYSACSAAAMTELLNAYGGHYRIHDILTVEAQHGDITPQLGLVANGGIADTLQQFGMTASWGTSLSLDQVIAIANGGTPVIVGWPPDRYAGGHVLIVVGGDSTLVQVVDSSAHNYTALSRTQFLAWWGGFSAMVTPVNQASGASPNSPYVAIARADAAASGISPDLFVRQIQIESGFNPNARSSQGAEGIAQFEPGTAASLGIDPWNPTQALQAAATLMASYNSQYGGDYAKALAAYNDGPGDASKGTGVAGAVQNCGAGWLSCMPVETQNYVRNILG